MSYDTLKSEGTFEIVDWCVDVWRNCKEDEFLLRKALEYMIRFQYEENWGYSRKFTNGVLNGTK